MSGSILICSCLAGLAGLAQTTTTNSPAKEPAAKKSQTSQSNNPGKGQEQSQGKGKPGIASRPTVIPRDSNNESGSGDSKGKGKPDSPGRPDKTPLPTEVSELVKKFQEEREKYLGQQKALERINQDKNATQDERAALREQMKDNLERLKEQHKALMKEMQERAKEIKSELNPALERILDGAQNEGRGR